MKKRKNNNEMNIHNDLTELIGNTPMLAMKRFMAKYGIKANLIAKMERFNPAGSAKDRIAMQMVEDAEKSGKLKAGGTIIEPTSGNTGVGLAFVSAIKGYKCIMVMPDTMSLERRTLLRAYGAKVELTKGALGMKGSIDRANELNQQIDNSIILQQFSNPSNNKAHYLTTAEEIWRDTDGKVDILVAGVGTGGTLCGTGKRLKELNPNIKVVAVEPATSPVLIGKPAGAHKLQGIGANFIPDDFKAEYVDEILEIENDPAIKIARELPATEGLLVGISSGAAVCGAMVLAKRPENAGKNIVVILPDTGERYLSTELFAFDEYPL